MKSNILGKIIFAICCSFLISSNNTIENHFTIDVISQDENSVIINYKINNFDINEVEVEGELYQSISLEGEPNFLIEGNPSLPHINRSLIIPDNASMQIEVLDADYYILNNMNILPSKGNLRRNIDPNTVPYIKGDIYNQNENFPISVVETFNPYILRDYRGQVLQLNPFLYNAFLNELTVYENITLKIEFLGENSINMYESRNNNELVYDYNQLYLNHFLNYDSYLSRYTPIDENGEMLVICYDSFCDEMEEFVDWKNQKGIQTTLVPKSTAGTTATSIKNYVQSFYNSNNLVYLLLVGDKSQIPTFEVGGGWSSGESDISYAYISGNDSYPEFFVGRFSANNTGQVSTMVERTIEYERDPQLNANWYTKGLMIASNEGAGAGHDGGESDWQHAQNMRDDLLDYNYNDVDEMYDGSHGGSDNNGNPSDSMVRTAINGGLGIIHYTGHGDTDVWVTSNFNTGDVNSLTNTNELPFICTVGCKSGDFGGTCLGEVFTYATSGNEPTGAVATFMSTIYQAWAPPMEAQDEMVDILTESYTNNRKYSFGGISWNGCLKMNDAYGSQGDDETDHWTLFGDPSVSLRTSAPSSLVVDHASDYNPSDGAYEITLNNSYDNIQATLSYDGEILGTAYGEGNFAIIVVDEDDVSNLDSMTLTVTGYNTTTYIGTVQIGNACPGYIPGDLNGSSSVNIQDVVLLINIVLGLNIPDECQLEFADLNQDGNIDILDVVLSVNLILGD